MAKNNDLAATVFGGLKTQVTEIDGKVNTLGIRVDKLEKQPQSGSPVTSIVDSGSVTIQLDEKTLEPIFIKAIKNVLEERDAYRRVQEAKAAKEGQIATMEQLVEYNTNAWSDVSETIKTFESIIDFQGNWLRSLGRLFGYGIKKDKDTFEPYILKSSPLRRLLDGDIPLVAENQDVKTKDTLSNEKPKIVYVFKPLPAAKEMLKYCFQLNFWIDTRVFILTMLLMLSFFGNYMAYNSTREWKKAQLKYELLRRMYSNSKSLSSEMRYLDQLFEDTDKNKEEIERLKKMP